MDHAAELRYYEILFIKTIHQFHEHYSPTQLQNFLEAMSMVSQADVNHIIAAMKDVLTNAPPNRIHRDEYIVCLKLFAPLNDTGIRHVAKCSPNTIKNCVTAYESGKLYITNKFDIIQSAEIRKLMQKMRAIAQIY